ncbi:carbohydrate ABC transporter permease [Rhizobium tubonense]|uniref:Sugar ABC transporter permease n=1 Tax=Rhizobium tubonense TaxID=484088 RepID=A0A2W4CPV4_9HYPH|nr:carbohydrate ABC transporter permease [Rhizobium tubonense]PZM12978.1 sugar ABC transporter permease [Rhizobium tubonense]
MSFQSHRTGGPLFRLFICACLVLFVIWSAAPILWMIISSVMKQQALIARPIDLSLSNLTLENFLAVMNSAALMGRGIFNSLVVSAFSTAIAIALGAPAAYALARLSVPHGNTIAFIVLATQMLPGIAIAIPLFLLISKLGLIDNVLTLGVVYLSFNLPIVIWILRGFFQAIPPSIERAAAIDGAGVIQTFWYVILPISVPPLTAAAVFAFVEAWNEFFFALILTRQSAQTLPLVIANFAGQYQTVFGQMMAAAAVSVLPVVLLAIVFRNKIIRGFADGMAKG